MLAGNRIRGELAPEFQYARIVEMTGWTEDTILDQRGYFLDYLQEYLEVKAEVEHDNEKRQQRLQEHHG